jgi:predicted nucleotidyltransferase
MLIMSISEIKEKITPILAAYGIKKASIFGSFSRGEERPDSDVDLLVELGPGPMDIFEYMQFKEDLEKKLGKDVDVVTNRSLSEHLKPYILPDLKSIYEG